MDSISSAEFRKTYARLTEPTEVTVNGHVIGRWSPISIPIRYTPHPSRPVADEDVVDFGLGTPEQQAAAAQRIVRGAPGTTIIGQQAKRDAILQRVNRKG